MEAVSRREMFCPHCNSMVPKSTYYRHRSMYYNVVSQCWTIANVDGLNEEWELNMEEDSTSLGLKASLEEIWNIEDYTNDEFSDNIGFTEASLLGQSQPYG